MELKYITENTSKNWMHEAYQLLMEKYMPKPLDEEKEQLEKLFEEWCKDDNLTTLNHLFEIIGSHESDEIRNLAIKSIKKHFPRSTIKSFIDMWITHPLPALHEFIEELIKSKSLSKPLLSVTYLMMDKLEQLNKIDPDYIHLDKYMNTLDPLLGSLVFSKYSQLTSTTLGETNKREFSIIDLIRLQDFQKLWDDLLSYPIPFISELIKIMWEENWFPTDPSDKILFDFLSELLGKKGWAPISEVLNTVVNKQEGNGFRPLNNLELKEKDYFLVLSPDLINRPDRITNYDFIPRGNRSLTHPDIGVNIYSETNRFSIVDGLLHIPFYSNEGIELAEFNIAATNINHFNMDEDGLYFTVRTKSGLYSLDIDAIAAILLPVNRHASGVSEIISELVEKTEGKSKRVMQALDLLSSYHLGREFTLFDKKDTKSSDEEENFELRCKCVLSVDVGNNRTKAYFLADTNCNLEDEEWVFPTIIHYQSPTEYITGDEVIEANQLNSSLTLSDLKKKLADDTTLHNILVHSSVITMENAFSDYLQSIVSKILAELEHDVQQLAITTSSISKNNFENRITKELGDFGFKRIEFITESQATSICLYRRDNIRGNIISIDIGEIQSTISLTKMDSPKSRKRTVQTRLKEEPLSPPTVITSLTVSTGISDLHPELSKLSRLSSQELNLVMRDLFNGFETKLTMEQFNDVLQKSNLLIQIKFGVRNVLLKAKERGVPKENLSTVIVNGLLGNNYVIHNLITELIDGCEIVSEKGVQFNTLGACLVLDGQQINRLADQDYYLKISNRGVTGFTKIFGRGEKVNGVVKTFDIRPKVWFDRIVIDLTTRFAKSRLSEENLPPKDDENIILNNIKDRYFFNSEFLLREQLPFDKDGELIVRTSQTGKLKIRVRSGKYDEILDTEVFIR